MNLGFAEEIGTVPRVLGAGQIFALRLQNIPVGHNRGFEIRLGSAS